MKILINKEIKLEDWNALSSASKFSSPFQTLEFYEFYNSLEGLSADVFAVEEKGELTSLVVISIQKEKGIKSYFSRRGIIYGGPIIRSDNNESLGFLLKSINRYYKKKLIYLETRNNFDYSLYHDIFSEQAYKYLPYLNYKIQLLSLEIVLKKFKSEKRRQIKKALKNGAEIHIAEKEEQVIELYQILKSIYSSRVKKPIPSLDYFIKIYNMFIKNNLGVFIIIMSHNKIIGGSICPIYNGIIYDWYRGGNDKDNKGFYPSTLAAYAGMEIGLKMGLKEFDFMGAGIKGEAYGVRDFKLQFGGELVEHGRYIKILNPLLYNIGVLGLKVLSKLKK